jgi:hypothetical protein
MVAAAARFVHELLIGRGEPLPCTLLSCRAYGTEEVFLGLLGTFSTGGVQRAPDLTNLPPGELNDLRWVSGSLVSRLQQTAREE